MHSKLITVDDLKFQTLVSCQKGIDKQSRPRPDPEVIKLFFVLNSAEHDIYPAHKC